MSSDSQPKRSEVLRELLLSNGLSASLYRAAAARSGMTVTDMQVIDILDINGPSTAGQLADITGLTTGAITGMLNRLEEAGLIHRERDPNDGRKVIVQLERGKDDMHKLYDTFSSINKAWDAMLMQYSDDQLSFLLDFLKSNNAIAREEIVHLQEAPSDDKEVFSAPLSNLQSARFVVSNGIYRLTLSADDQMTDLYRARFEGPLPEIKTKDGVVTLRYPKRLFTLSKDQPAAQVALSTRIPWQIMVQGGLYGAEARLGNLNLASLEIKGGFSTTNLELPTPSGVVPIKISGGASEITIRRPAGTAARVHLKGWASELIFDDQTFSYLGNNVHLLSRNFDANASYYDFEIASSASSITITAN